MMGADTAASKGTTELLGRIKPALRRARRVSSRNPTMVAGLGVMLAMIIIALAAPLVATQDHSYFDPIDRLQGPSGDHWFGTDKIGRDIYSRTVFGTRVSLAVGFAVALATMIVGSIIALVAGFYRKADMILMRIMDGFMAIPTLLLAIALMAILGASIKNVFISLLVVMTPQTVRVVRASVLSLREEVYVEAARAIGAPDWRILAFHVFPGTIASLIIQGTYTCAVTIIIEASLSFLGAGIPPDVPSWGIIMAEGKEHVVLAFWIILFPGIALFLAVLGINLAGDGLRDILDPKLARRG